MDVSDIGHPDLIYGVYFHISDHVRTDPESVIAVGCSYPSLPGAALQSLLPHDPGNLLVVDSQSLTMKLLCYSAIPIAGKLQTDIANAGFQALIRSFFFILVVKTPPGQIHQFTPPLNAFDKGAILGNELSLFSVCFRLLHTSFFKNSFSRVTLPSRRSSS